MRTFRFILSVVVISVAVVACGGEEPAPTTSQAPTNTATVPTTTSPPTTGAGATPTSQASITTTAAPSTTVPPSGEGTAVYFLLEDPDPEAAGPYLVPVFRSVDPSDPVGVVESLLAGPTSDEAAGIPSISTAIPEGVDLLGVEVKEGRADVDLSGSFDDGGGSFSMLGRLAQMTFTLTRIPTVEEVVFRLDGEPVTTFSSEGIELDGPKQRKDYYDLLPPIFVDQPAWGEMAESPMEVRGLSNVFEATSQVMLTDDDGLPLDQGTVTATCGTGCWGEWEATIEYAIDRAQFGALIVWANSAKDGSPIHILEYPVRLR